MPVRCRVVWMRGCRRGFPSSGNVKPLELSGRGDLSRTRVAGTGQPLTLSCLYPVKGTGHSFFPQSVELIASGTFHTRSPGMINQPLLA